MRSSKVSNFSRYQAQRVVWTTNALTRALRLCTDEKYACRCITHLAKHVAKIITEEKRSLFIEQVSVDGLAFDVSQLSTSYTNLLKTTSYRCLLDEWMGVHASDMAAPGAPDNRVVERKLKLRILELTNMVRFMRGEVEGLERKSFLGSEVVVQEDLCEEDLSDAFKMVEILLGEFKDYVLVEASGLVVDNSLRKILIPAEKFNKYLRWRKFNSTKLQFFGK